MGHNHHQHDHSSHEHHDHHDHHHHGNFKKLFLISLPIGLLIMWISPLMGLSIPFPFQYTFQYADILGLVLSTILLIYGGKPFYQGAATEFKQRKPGMMALVSLGLSVSFLYSVFAIIMRYTSNIFYMDFLFEFASLILIMLLGHWIEMVALGKAGDAKESLAMLLPKEVNLVTKSGEIKVVSINALKPGNIVQVKAGEAIPADGIIIKGQSRINESLLTGEVKPVSKDIGDRVIGGSTNDYGLLEVKVTETGVDSFLSQVQNLVQEAENRPARSEDMARKVSELLFYIAVSVSIIAFITWWIITDLDQAISYTVTTLVIACPHALGLAIPLVISRSTSIGSESGLLVKNREVYNLTTKATTIVLDKTGTLTTGEFKVLKIEVFDQTKYSSNDILGLLAGIEEGSSHPIAESITRYATNQKVKATKFSSVQVIPGIGLTGSIGSKNYSLISVNHHSKNSSIENTEGLTVSVLLLGDNAIGVVYLGDELKESSKHLINVLKARNITPIIATGDNEEAAKSVADKLEVSYYANQSPEDKYSLVKRLQEEGEVVIMVGDGINDSPSLVLSDVGVAIGAGTKVAIDSADVILTQSEPGDIESFISLSYRTNRKMKENLLWGAGYNFIVIPLAAGILAGIGFTLTPAVGAVLMSLSTIIVAINAMLLKK